MTDIRRQTSKIERPTPEWSVLFSFAPRMLSSSAPSYVLRRPSSSVPQPVHQRLFLAAVDLDHRAVDEERKVGGKERDQVGDFLRFRDAAQRNARRSELVGLFEAQIHVARHGLHQAGPALGTHRSRIDADEADI